MGFAQHNGAGAAREHGFSRGIYWASSPLYKLSTALSSINLSAPHSSDGDPWSDRASVAEMLPRAGRVFLSCVCTAPRCYHSTHDNQVGFEPQFSQVLGRTLTPSSSSLLARLSISCQKGTQKHTEESFGPPGSRIPGSPHQRGSWPEILQLRQGHITLYEVPPEGAKLPSEGKVLTQSLFTPVTADPVT